MSDERDPLAPFRSAAEQLSATAERLLEESRAIDEQVDADLDGFRRRAGARRDRVHAAVRAIVARLNGC